MQNADQSIKESVFIFGLAIDQQSVRDFVINLVQWSERNPGRPLRINLNSQGGSILDGLSLYEEFQRLRREHRLTIAVYGRSASTAGWLLQAADVRIIGAQSWILIHEVSHRAEGPLSLLKREVERTQRLQDQTIELLTSRSRLTRERIEKEIADGHDWWLTAKEAKQFGLVDIIEEAPAFQTVQ